MTYGCHNREPFKPHIGQDGWRITEWPNFVEPITPIFVTIPQTMAKDCQYTLSELGKTDRGCEGCKHKKLTKGAT